MGDSPFSRVVRVARTGSTNDDLRAAALAEPEAWPHGSVLVTDHQDAGKGRAGRGWETPAGVAMTASVLLRPRVLPHRLPWLPLVTGLAVQRALTVHIAMATDSSQTPRFGVKWPNDVLALDAGADELPGLGRNRKLAGILVEALPASARAEGAVAVIGIGLNVLQESGDMPVPTATSLRALGIETTPTAVLNAVGRELLSAVSRWADADGDVVRSGLRAEISDACVTVGADVRAELPGGEVLTGRAIGLGDEGQLRLRTGAGIIAVSAGDVLHLRRT